MYPLNECNNSYAQYSQIIREHFENISYVIDDSYNISKWGCMNLQITNYYLHTKYKIQTLPIDKLTSLTLSPIRKRNWDRLHLNNNFRPSQMRSRSLLDTGYHARLLMSVWHSHRAIVQRLDLQIRLQKSCHCDESCQSYSYFGLSILYL